MVRQVAGAEPLVTGVTRRECRVSGSGPARRRCPCRSLGSQSHPHAEHGGRSASLSLLHFWARDAPGATTSVVLHRARYTIRTRHC